MDAAKDPTDDDAGGSGFSLTDDDRPSTGYELGTSDLIPLIDDDDADEDDEGGTSGSRLKHIRRRILRHEHVRKNLMVSCPKLTGCTVM